ncbi:protein 5NUC [Drosophila virilis]|uniref:5'-nucleotidase n=1 Tax=Drosophila virilis TaxID=7244 RepID=B4LPU8_DROVI|nr:protein 5NUC [Drosophila virilis]EDW61288.1 uncharacterized protein Dvir_GJ21951 [Drosophila virilis]
MELWLKLYWSSIILLVLVKQDTGLKFSVVHTNDMHARYDPMKDSNEKCDMGDDEKGLCFGGFARVATAVAKARAEGPTIFLNAGDTFQGTPWFTIFRSELAGELMNMLNPDAMSLGNHELDDNVNGLVPFLQMIKFPVVCCNIILKNAPVLQNMKSLVHSTIITKFEKKIGIIGYLTPVTRKLVSALDIEIHNEIPYINAEAKKLTDKGVDIIIALGHSGYSMDQDIARSCQDIDLVVGGHSHTFLFTGTPPERENPVGNYPTVVTRTNGQQVLVLQAYAYTKYLGKIDLEFDNGGRLIKYSGSPILLDNTVAHDSAVKALLDSKRATIDELETQVVGVSKVVLNGDREVCRQSECNFGNFIGDALVYGRVIEDYGGLYWTDAAIALMNSGGIRASIDPGPDGTVTGVDIATALPYGNTVSVTRIKGHDLVKALEYSAALRHTDSDGGFLQVSGLRLVINYNRPKGKRVTSINVLCADCRIPKYEPLERDKFYSVIVPSFILNGGDGHRHFKDPIEPELHRLKLIDREILTKYYQEHKIVYPMLESRITIIEKKRRSCAPIRSQSLLVPIALVTFLYHFI